MEIVGVDAHLVLYGGQLIGLADAVGDEGTVVDALRHIALVAAEQQHVVEVEVAGFQNAHHLDTFGRLAMEGDGGLLDELVDKALQRGVRHLQVATVYQRLETVDERIGTEQRLLE